MKLGTLLFILFWAVVVGGIIVGVFRRRSPPKVSVETRGADAGAPRDHVEIVIVSPSKGVHRRLQWLLDHEYVDPVDLTDRTCSLRTVPGGHSLTAKHGVSTYEYAIDCPRNGRYEIHLKIDRLLGRLSKDFRVIVSHASS